MRVRTRARELALQFLYQLDLTRVVPRRAGRLPARALHGSRGPRRPPNSRAGSWTASASMRTRSTGSSRSRAELGHRAHGGDRPQRAAARDATSSCTATTSRPRSRSTRRSSSASATRRRTPARSSTASSTRSGSARGPGRGVSARGALTGSRQGDEMGLFQKLRSGLLEDAQPSRRRPARCLSRRPDDRRGAARGARGDAAPRGPRSLRHDGARSTRCASGWKRGRLRRPRRCFRSSRPRWSAAVQGGETSSRTRPRRQPWCSSSASTARARRPRSRKLAASLDARGARCCSGRATPSAPPRSSSSRSGPSATASRSCKQPTGADPAAVAFDAVSAGRAGARHDYVHRRHGRPPAHAEEPDAGAREGPARGRQAHARARRTRCCSCSTRPTARTRSSRRSNSRGAST